MERRALIPLAALAASLTLGAAGWGQTAPPGRDLDRLVGLMSGEFSSAEQAAADTSYFDIHLRMQPIWTDRSDGHWLYVEQAVASMPEKPYRQRVYQVVQLTPDLFESRVWKLPGEQRWIGAWKSEAPLASLSPDSLLPRDGCSIVLRRTAGGGFAGSTIGHECESELRGASFATSEVTITPEALISWDRGFDAQGHQVWGAEKGGYRFLRVGS